jgi:RND family efflux transporter MFP subunit
MYASRIAAVALVAVTIAGCEKKDAPFSQARPVRTLTVERHADGDIISLTGQIRAKDQASLAFRLDGRMIERAVQVGDVLKAGQVVARLDPQNQRNAQRSAQANLGAAEAALAQTRSAFMRQQELLKDGWTPRARFDEAQQNFLTAKAQVESAEAQLQIAEDQLSYTTLTADAPGVVTAVGAEPGEVIRAGQMIVQLARQGGRDAVFDVSEQIVRTAPRDPAVQLALTDDASVIASGRVREVSPQADSATRTHQVKVGIVDPPEAMRLGATVTGKIKLAAPAGVVAPASALTEAEGHPAVWVVDRKSETVALRDVDVLRYNASDVIISKGLETGEVVVTAGVQSLHPGQKVRLLGGAS